MPFNGPDSQTQSDGNEIVLPDLLTCEIERDLTQRQRDGMVCC